MSPQNTLTSLQTALTEGRKITALTAYDAAFAHHFSNWGIDVLLVGDSLGMVLQGQPSTLAVSMTDMLYHTRCVAQGNQSAFVMADMPFNSYSHPKQCQKNAGLLMQAGAQAVKLEGGAWLNDSIQSLSQSGIPTCIHLGLTPQSVNKFGGYSVQGRSEHQAQQLFDDALSVTQAGADLLLLECVPSLLAKRITQAVDIPVIGIGAGPDTDGQVLVSYDLLGITPNRLPRFVKNYLCEHPSLEQAVKAYIHEVQTGLFPTDEHSFN